MDKAFAVLKYGSGKYSIVTDYGDYAWNSPLYELVDYYPTMKAAREAVRRFKEFDAGLFTGNDPEFEANRELFTKSDPKKYV